MTDGQLILCSLPIGKKEDITLSVLEALKIARFIVAEDTRSIRKVINDYGYKIDDKKIISFHDQSRPGEVDKIFELLENGENVYYFSEAGSPVISDPAFPLVKSAHEKNIKILSYPGACSLITALEVSGIPATPFTFMGFLPRETSKIQSLLEKLSNDRGTFVFFESPRRVKNIINLLGESLDSPIFPDHLCFTRELTKVNQQVLLLNKNNFMSKVKELVHLGEFVVVLRYDRKGKVGTTSNKVSNLCMEMLDNGVSNKKLSKLFSELTGISSKSIYQKLSAK